MRRIYLLLVAMVAANAFAQTSFNKNLYPKTRTVDTVTDYFGTKVSDPYRWLENDTAADVKKWVDSENEVTFNYLKQIPYREQIKNRLTSIYNYPKYSDAIKIGENIFYNYNDGLKNQSQIMIQTGLSGTAKVFMDPNLLSKEGTATITIDGFSKDRKYCAYHVNRAGSDWETTYVINVASGQNTGDSLKWLKFGGAAWKGNGFYYSGYDAPAGGNELLAKNEYQKIFYHKLGDPQSKDQLIYQDKDHPLRYVDAQTTEDERFLILYISEGTFGNEMQYKDLNVPNDNFHLVFKGFAKNYAVLDDVGDKFLVQTNDGAENSRVILVDPKNSGQE